MPLYLAPYSCFEPFFFLTGIPHGDYFPEYRQPDLAEDLKTAISTKFGDDFGPTAEKFIKLQGVVDNSDLKHVDMVTLVEGVKDAGGKPIQINKLKDFVSTQATVSQHIFNGIVFLFFLLTTFPSPAYFHLPHNDDI